MVGLWRKIIILNIIYFFLSKSTEQTVYSILYKPLSDANINSCLVDADLATSTIAGIGLTCVGGYHDYLDPNVQCANNQKYFNLELTLTPPCDSKQIHIN